MKIHKDGTLEGTPDELAAYLKLQEGQPYILPSTTIISTTGVDVGKYPGNEQCPYTLDRTKSLYDPKQVIYGYNGDQNTDERNVFAARFDIAVSKITGGIS
ncbi:hypothetical protein BSK66_25595 [Paenibacillus odorifer]|uniref:hypothetical protein n=1 Tax=Paenibacillus TaxID=44249 RepID=UPI0003E23B7E|nr:MULTISPECIES: hypothetical protein [Paenibacillus]ETT46290.1 hypothetical protein C171_28582 [Paenibacillus sp. FSL H8-237]OME50216.1 hypothetical protein BSK66_25595 [Paenibacillus odorifer]